MKIFKYALFILITSQLFFCCRDKGNPGEVEVLNWWNSGKEAAAVSVLKELLEAEGHTWTDSVVTEGEGDNAMTILKTRVENGNLPAAAQVKGSQIQSWGDEGVLANLNDVAEENYWDAILPPVVAEMMKYKGNYVAVPVNVHRINWMWCNIKVFEQAGVDIPETWEQFEDACQKIKAAGYIPVAWGGQPWQEATVFEIIVAAVGGTSFYNKALIEADITALGSDTMVRVLDRLKMIKQYTDPGAPGRDWNLATAMVIKGEAAMQFMGDQVKGEFIAAGKEPYVDYVAAPAPETDKQFIFTIDSFIMFKVEEKNETAQKAMARLILEPKVQEIFNVHMGSIPVRLGMPEDPFDAPARLAMRDFVKTLNSGNLLNSMAHELAVMPEVRGAILDTVTVFYNSDMSSTEAAAQLASAVKAVR